VEASGTIVTSRLTQGSLTRRGTQAKYEYPNTWTSILMLRLDGMEKVRQVVVQSNRKDKEERLGDGSVRINDNHEKIRTVEMEDIPE